MEEKQIENTIISVRNGEIVVDFVENNAVVQRIIILPQNLVTLLQQSKKKLLAYEQENGKIHIHTDKKTNFINNLYNNLFYSKKKGNLLLVSGKKVKKKGD